MYALIVAAVVNSAFLADMGNHGPEARTALCTAPVVLQEGTNTIAAAHSIDTPPTLATVPTVAPGDDPAIDALVRRFWDQLASGTVDRSILTPDLAAQLTPVNLAQVRESISKLGQVRSFTFVGKQAGTESIYRYTLEFAGGIEREWDVTITADQKIADSEFAQ
jgi:hypothetical protein